MERHDTIVLVAGVIGAAAALHLAGRGRPLVLERHAFLHERGGRTAHDVRAFALDRFGPG